VTGRVFDDGHGPDSEQQATAKYQITQCFIRRERDPAMHPAGVKVSGGELATVNVVRRMEVYDHPKSKALQQ
jgi:hypothetical protein